MPTFVPLILNDKFYGDFYIHCGTLVLIAICSILFSSPLLGTPDVYHAQMGRKILFRLFVRCSGLVLHESKGLWHLTPTSSRACR